MAEHKRLQDEVFPDLRVGLLHGKMKPAEKEARAGAFPRRRDRCAGGDLGRGGGHRRAKRDGDGGARRPTASGWRSCTSSAGAWAVARSSSYCILLAESASASGQQRLQAITSTDDGFKLAENDLELRGAGEFWGTRQSGLPELQVAGLGDARTIEEAREAPRQRIVAARPRPGAARAPPAGRAGRAVLAPRADELSELKCA